MKLDYKVIRNSTDVEITLELEEKEKRAIEKHYPPAIFALPQSKSWVVMPHKKYRTAVRINKDTLIAGLFVEGRWKGRLHRSSISLDPGEFANKVKEAAQKVVDVVLEWDEGLSRSS